MSVEVRRHRGPAPEPRGPEVSVVIPTWNRLGMLKEAVASVQAQTHGNWEVVVADGGSTDGTVRWLRGLEDPRVRVVEGTPGSNPARLRNLALGEVRGRYVAFLDADDLWAPRKLELHLARMESHPGVGWSYSAVNRIDARGHSVSSKGIQPWRPISGWILPELLAMKALLATPAVVAARPLLEAAGGFDEALDYCEDYDLWFRLAARAPVLALCEALASVRVHPGSYSADRTAVHGGWVQVYDKARRRDVEPGLEALCRVRARHHAITRAALLMEEGNRSRAVREILGVLRRAPVSRRAWRVLLSGALPNRAPAAAER